MSGRRVLVVSLLCVFCGIVPIVADECSVGYGAVHYTQLEYIESTGTQYIDTGIEYSTNAVLDLEGTATTSELVKFILSSIDSDVYQEGFGQYKNAVAGFNTIDITVRTTCNVAYTNQSMTVNGLTLDTYNLPNDSRLSLFGSRDASRCTDGLKMYSARIYNGTSLVFDGIPAKRNSDSVIGIYDTVSRQFFTNAGTGEFIAGPETPTEFMNLHTCSPCPPNTYKDFVGNTECTPCPDRLVAPSGAISVDECGRILHIGDYNAYMPAGRRTEHGLCTMLDGVKYCADLYEKK